VVGVPGQRCPPRRAPPCPYPERAACRPVLLSAASLRPAARKPASTAPYPVASRLTGSRAVRCDQSRYGRNTRYRARVRIVQRQRIPTTAGRSLGVMEELGP
jgi:hypothetical protein